MAFYKTLSRRPVLRFTEQPESFVVTAARVQQPRGPALSFMENFESQNTLGFAIQERPEQRVIPVSRLRPGATMSEER